ncbi:MAG: hypothetical protein ABW155_10510 [Candidatus Thiodiazotropha sp.]
MGWIAALMPSERKKSMHLDPTTVFDLFRYLNQLLAKISHCGPAISGVTVYPSQVDLAINSLVQYEMSLNERLDSKVK